MQKQKLFNEIGKTVENRMCLIDEERKFVQGSESQSTPEMEKYLSA